MKPVSHLLFAIFTFLQIVSNAQTLVLTNKQNGSQVQITPGDIFYVQTLDDPEGFMTKVRFISYDGVNMEFDRPFNPLNKQQTIKVPVSHIGAFYFRKPWAGALKFILIAGGAAFEIGSLGLIYEKDMLAVFDILAGVPLIKAGLDVRKWKRFYLPGCLIYEVKKQQPPKALASEISQPMDGQVRVVV